MGIVALTASFPLVTRMVVGVLLAIPALVLVHKKVQDQSLLHWLYLYARSFTVPRYATWQSVDELRATRRRAGSPPPCRRRGSSSTRSRVGSWAIASRAGKEEEPVDATG